MSIIVIGASHRALPLDSLANLTLDDASQCRLSAALGVSEHVTGHLVLITCNRVEVYLSAPSFDAAFGETLWRWADVLGHDRSWLAERVYFHRDEPARVHALSVATGLDSLALGEPQIRGQFRAAYRRAAAHGHIDAPLHRFCQDVLRGSRTIRAQTNLAHVAPSLIETGLDKAGDYLGDLRHAHVALLGSGNLAALAAASMERRALGGGAVYARNRARALALTAKLGSRWHATTDLDDALDGADLVLSAVSCGRPIVTTDVLRRRPGRPARIFLDFGMPPTVEHSVTSRPGTHRLGLADMAGDLDARQSEAIARARELVALHGAEHRVRSRADTLAPTLCAMRAHAAAAIDEEVARVAKRGPHVTHEELRDALHRLSGKLLHPPILATKEAISHSQDPHVLATALHQIYAGQIPATR